MSSNLHQYFQISNVQSGFIYDPDNRVAFFGTTDPSDVFITKKLNTSLFYRASADTSRWTPPAPPPPTKYTPELLKSNLQKAIRRKHTDIAVSTLAAMLALSQVDVFRRLPIIYVEDVCLMSSFPIVVWLMMADKEYTLKRVDVFILLNIVVSLCETDRVFVDSDTMPEYTGKPESCANAAVRALYYRAKYGGMKGDMAMLRRAIQYYHSNPGEIVETKWAVSVRIRHVVEILPESIDFHPFPKMLWEISKQTRLSQDLIKKTIWFAQSGVNVRKPETNESSVVAQESAAWSKIHAALTEYRQTFQ